ncbi:MAG: WD40/YVTN/BNR-like repeat-containing protein, partial [Acidobacteriota bacterium]
DVTGEEHFSTIYEIQESPHQAGVIWVGANDGPIHLTRDGGKTWQDVTPKELGPYGRVQNIEVSPHDPAKAYAAVLRYQLGDFQPYGFKTEDYGQTWVRITTGENGIPNDFPVRVVREDPDREGLLYAGTEFGMFISFDDGQQWQPFQLNLPVTPVTDIKIVHQDLVFSTMGRGFWILDDLTPLHELSPKLASRDLHLFAIRDAYRLHGPGRFGRSSRRPEEPRYPRPGARITYYASHPPEAEIGLEILDDGGRVIRQFSSAPPTSPAPSQEANQRPEPFGRSASSRLAKDAGTHRFVWDLRYPGPWDKETAGSRGGGPMVPPGTYQARLSSGGWSQTRAFQVRLDPRVEKEGITEIDIQAQVKLALEVGDTLSRARRTAARLEEAKKALDEPDEQLRAGLSHLQSQLVTASVRYSRPMLIDQLAYLYENLIRADQRPGHDAYQRYDELRRTLRDYTLALEKLLPNGAAGKEAGQ